MSFSKTILNLYLMKIPTTKVLKMLLTIRTLGQIALIIIDFAPPATVGFTQRS